MTGTSNLNRLAYFTAVVETGSFTAAAERLGITKAVVSQQVARLEQEFRTTLLVRSTRRVRTTEAGQVFYYRCAAILKEAEEAFEELSESASEPTGTLRLTAPFDYGIGVVVPAITEFSQRYPQCKVEAHFSDQTLDLGSHDLDLSIRVGWITEQHLQARRIGHFEQRLVAGPQWRTQVDALQSPEDLAELPLVANTALREPTRWAFSRGESERVVEMKSSVALNATLAVREATLQGAGLSVLPDYVAAPDLEAGRLIEVLPGWALPRGEIHVVFPTARFRPVKVRVFTELLASRTLQT
ncbi:LysR family transcriptional regulator [Pseudomonas entomophila]|uniref:LysR family transcriptional regulator n=1 Tax=Pseudomonas entomophila TaxID=312306 RepID=UPI001BCF2A55|nr:LysR family transcriptional regulator [Pseudomonas entomophila]QVM93872.1 LysR family transcriptional regulator [Pseudomonas entomophila]